MLPKVHDEYTSKHCSMVLVNELKVWWHVLSCPNGSHLSEPKSIFAILCVGSETITLKLDFTFIALKSFFKDFIFRHKLPLLHWFIQPESFHCLNIGAALGSSSPNHAKIMLLNQGSAYIHNDRTSKQCRIEIIANNEEYQWD